MGPSQRKYRTRPRSVGCASPPHLRPRPREEGAAVEPPSRRIRVGFSTSAIGASSRRIRVGIGTSVVPSRRIWVGFSTSVVLALALAGCGGADPATAVPAPAAANPDPFARKVGGLSCADCHSTTAEDQPRPDRRRVGHTLADATRRPSWWHGELDASKGATVLDAVLTCVARFQHRTWNTTFTDLSKVEVPAADRAALVACLESLARPGPHLPSPAKKDDSREALLRVEALTGDAARGREAWAKACALCHGDGSENHLGPSLRGKLAPDRRRVIDYVRSGPRPTDRRTAVAWMPFFTPDVLPDQDLADLAELIDGGAW